VIDAAGAVMVQLRGPWRPDLGRRFQRGVRIARVREVDAARLVSFDLYLKGRIIIFRNCPCLLMI